MSGLSVTTARRRTRNSTTRRNRKRRNKQLQQQHGLYVWEPLAANEIRILTLLPGRFEDNIRIQVTRTQLLEATTPSPARMTRWELQTTVPPDWTVEEALDGRYIFLEWGQGELLITRTWTHPDPEFDHSRYEAPSYEAPTDSNNGFEALSYAWGLQEDPELAFVEDIDGRCIGTVSVGRNLDEALRHLRHEHKIRKLWVDTICINQADNDEKSVQVRQMARVYRSAQCVVAWIGSESDGSHLAMSTLEYLGSQVMFGVSGLAIPSPDAQEEKWYQPEEELPFSDEVWEAICHLVGRRWFSRRWVVQEIIVANPSAILQCGRSEVLWSLFREAFQCLHSKKSLSELVRRIVFRAVKVAANRLEGPVSYVLDRLYAHECSDQRDIVYALLGIMPPKLASIVDVDYTVSPANAFKSLFLAHIGHVQRWELFGCVLNNRSCGGPSWVPDLSTHPERQGGLDFQYSSGLSRIHFTLPRADVLDIDGVLCATVATASPSAFGTSLDRSRIVRSWEPPNMDEATYVTGEPLSDVYARTLLQDRVMDRWPNTSLLDLEDFKASGGNGLFGQPARHAAEEDYDSFNEAEYVSSMAASLCHGRSFVTTAEGYIGLGPDGVMPGDIICVFLGCYSPLVLRPLPEGRYHLVGRAFVHGLHDAIPLLGPLPPPWVVQIEATNQHLQFYLRRSDTGEITREDPRLVPDPEWDRVELADLGRDLTGDDPLYCDFFKNKTTGELVNYDPRLSPEALKARGVPIQTFSLV